MQNYHTPPSSPSETATSQNENNNTNTNNNNSNNNNSDNGSSSTSTTTSTSSELIVSTGIPSRESLHLEDLPYENHEFDAYCWQKNGANKSLKNGVFRQHYRCSQYSKGKGECKARTHVDRFPDGTQVVGRSLLPHNHPPPSSSALKFNQDSRDRPRSIYPEPELSPSLGRRTSEDNINNNNVSPAPQSQPRAVPRASPSTPTPSFTSTSPSSNFPTPYSTPTSTSHTPSHTPSPSSSSSSSYISSFTTASNFACSYDPYKISELHNQSAFILHYGLFPYFSLTMAPSKSLEYLASHGSIICVDGPHTVLREAGRAVGERELDYQLLTLMANVDGSFIPLAFYITNAKKKQEAYEKFFSTLRSACVRLNPTIIFCATDANLVTGCKAVFPNAQIASGDQCLEGWRKRLRSQYHGPMPLERLNTAVQILLDEWGYHQELITCETFFLPLPRKHNRYFPPDNPTPPPPPAPHSPPLSP